MAYINGKKVLTVNGTIYMGENLNVDATPQADTSDHILAFTENKGIYVGTDTGHWYGWDGTHYVDGGVYQATAIADGSITPEKTSFISFSKNLFDRNNVLNGYIQGGTYTENSLWRCNINYRVLLSNTITVSNNTNCIIDIYDENKTYLSNQVLTNDVTYNIRSDAKYIRISVDKNRVDTFQCEFGNSATTYEEYHKPQFNDELDDYVLNSEFNDLTKNIVKNDYIFNRLPFGSTMQFNINDFTYVADGFWSGSAVVSSLSGRKVYKLENVIKYIDTIQLGSGNTANTLFLYDSNDNLKLTINDNTLYKLHTYIDDGGYILMNYWGASGDEVYSKVITLKTFDVDIINKPKISIRTCVNKPFNFNGKTALFFGDSITVGFNGTTTVTNNYVKLFSDKVGLTYTNMAIGGSLFTRGKNEVECIIDTIKNATLNTDFIFIAGGCNDWQLGVTESEFDDAMNELFTYLSANYSGEVIFISPIEHINNGWWGRNAINDLNVYRNIIGEYCMKYSYSFIDTSTFNFNSDNTTFNNLFYGDGLHPSELGYKLYANSLLTILE